MNRTHLELHHHRGGAAIQVHCERLSITERLAVGAACLRALIAGRFVFRAPHAVIVERPSSNS